MRKLVHIYQKHPYSNDDNDDDDDDQRVGGLGADGMRPWLELFYTWSGPWIEIFYTESYVKHSVHPFTGISSNSYLKLQPWTDSDCTSEKSATATAAAGDRGRHPLPLITCVLITTIFIIESTGAGPASSVDYSEPRRIKTARCHRRGGYEGICSNLSYALPLITNII